MTEHKKPIIERIRKLLRLDASRGASEAEAAAALKLAHRLMVKHAIEQADVDDRDRTMTTAVLVEGRRLPRELRRLAILVQGHFNVNAIECTRRADHKIELIGRQADVAVAEHVWIYLRRQCHELWLRHKAAHRSANRYSFWVGMIQTLDAALSESMREARRQDPAAATALALSREALDRDIRRERPDIKPAPAARPVVVSDHRAAMAGMDAAKKIRLRPAIE